MDRPIPESTTEPATDPKHLQIIFSTPENATFYSWFSYRDLNPIKREIRLIRLSIEDENLISCSFHVKQLDQVKGKYYSLSYFAGSPHDSRRILVEGIPFNVFANLEHALKQVLSLWKRSPISQEEDDGALPLIWVDQICINQHNDEERSHQVNFMRDIYSNCRETIVSLSIDGGVSSIFKTAGSPPTNPIL